MLRSKIFPFAAASVGIFLSIRASPVLAQCELGIAASDAASNKKFGEAVSVSGDWVLVGAANPFAFQAGPGSAYFFRREGTLWVQEARVTGTAAAGTTFGSAVAIDGDLAAVGARNSAGSVHIFRHEPTGWTEETQITASDAALNDEFGTSVSICEDLVLIGAPRNDDGATDAGSAYVFRRDGSMWIEQAKLIPADPGNNDRFGHSVSISGDTAIVGAFLDNVFGLFSGSAYVFRRDDNGTPDDPNDDLWVEGQKLIASDAAAGDRFGNSVAISGNVIVVGSRRDDDAGTSTGSAYVFRFDGTTWVEEQKILASDADAFDAFGQSVAVAGDMIVVGAEGTGLETGFAYVYRFRAGTWVEVHKITASDGGSGDEFGHSVSVDGSYAVVGAPKDDNSGNSSGSAYVYQLLGGPDCNANTINDACELDCNENGIPDDCDLTAGTSQDCTANGIPDECEPDCNTNGIADSCEIADGSSEDCTGNGIPDECEPDCNTNGFADSCEIADGSSEDCTGNDIPDECEPDCNANGIADSCDVAAGTDICILPLDTGPCLAICPRFFYNACTGQCEPFTWGCCAGNANNFLTVGECRAACSPNAIPAVSVRGLVTMSLLVLTVGTVVMRKWKTVNSTS